MKPFITQGLAKGFRRGWRKETVLQDVDVELVPGTVTVLLGPNGAGKSTLMKLGLGLLRPDAGTVRVLGLDPVRDARQVKERTGYVPDAPDAPRWMTPRELYRFLAPQYPRWDASVVERMVESQNLPLDVPFRALSRGQGAKAMLAAALAPKPELLLFDEAFSGLDPLARNELLTGFLEEFRVGEGTALVATHDLDLAARIADRVIVLAHGRVTAAGTVDEVLGTTENDKRPIPRGLLALLADARDAEVAVR